MVKGGYSLSSRRTKNSQLKRQMSVEIHLNLTLMPVKLVYNIVIFFGKTKQKVRVNVKDTLCPFQSTLLIYLGWMGKGDQSMTFLQLLEHTFTLLVWWGLTQ